MCFLGKIAGCELFGGGGRQGSGMRRNEKWEREIGNGGNGFGVGGFLLVGG